MNAMVERSNLFNVRVTDDELRMIRELAEHLGLSQSDAVRQLVRRSHAEVFGPAKPKRPKPKR